MPQFMSAVARHFPSLASQAPGFAPFGLISKALSIKQIHFTLKYSNRGFHALSHEKHADGGTLLLISPLPYSLRAVEKLGITCWFKHQF